jgi:hypothetical protein
MKSGPFLNLRRSRRTPEANPIPLAIASEDYQVNHQAFTMNRSLHGLRIRTAVPLSPGETVVISRREGSRHTIPAHVVWVREPIPSAEYIAGLEFLSHSAA